MKMRATFPQGCYVHDIEPAASEARRSRLTQPASRLDAPLEPAAFASTPSPTRPSTRNAAFATTVPRHALPTTASGVRP